jgi:hypothetical protein
LKGVCGCKDNEFDELKGIERYCVGNLDMRRVDSVDMARHEED